MKIALDTIPISNNLDVNIRTAWSSYVRMRMFRQMFVFFPTFLSSYEHVRTKRYERAPIQGARPDAQVEVSARSVHIDV